MCEIFCFNSNMPRKVNECLECFYNHSEEHPHGWGLATMHSDEFIVKKEPVKATCSEQLKDILSRPVVGKNVFAHIRLATVGEMVSVNCHPFVEYDDSNRMWMLIHNGTIFDFPELEKYRDKEKGTTDSERILLYIIDKVNEFEHEKGAPSTIKERFRILEDIIFALSKGNKLNIMVYDGDLTYVHSNLRQSLYYLEDDDGILVASSPVSDDDGWKQVELNKVFGLIDGKIVFESPDHGNEFVFTEEHEKIMRELLESYGLMDLYDLDECGKCCDDILRCFKN